MHSVRRNRFIIQRVPANESQQAMVGAAAMMGAEAAPPKYEEVAPPQHQSIAGRISVDSREQEESGMVADGKTPLSEIPFEDVMLNYVHSGSSCQPISMGHQQVGDRTAHIN